MHMIKKRPMVVDAEDEGRTAAELFSSLAASTPLRPDHYPYRFSKHLATRQPSTSNVKSRRPRHKVRTPGIPSL
jgi:hypothetical protein